MRPSITSAIVNTPLRKRAFFDEALAETTARDAEVLASFLAAGYIDGDWRRAAVRKRIEELRISRDERHTRR